YTRAIARGTAEVKRDVLHKIRSHRSERASELAVPALADRDPMIRATAASAIVWLPRERAAAVLIPLLRDRDEFVRREAAYALGVAGTDPAIPELMRILRSDRDPEVRAAAAIALGGIGSAGEIPALVGALNMKRSEENEFLRSMAARTIGQIAIYARSGERVEIVPQNFLPANYKHVLADKPTASVDPTVVRLLLRMLRDEQEHMDLRRHVAFALGAIGDASLEAPLRALTQSSDPYMAEIAREALQMLADRTAGN
ncbi:MAG TPA: HEAT repeat domain-containing protein, partial [Pyrinomonadaceae bacterium]|nr:HEAT repeat domain-containing protein [Pyrinomonadaceae bacterium]